MILSWSVGYKSKEILYFLQIVQSFTIQAMLMLFLLYCKSLCCHFLEFYKNKVFLWWKLKFIKNIDLKYGIMGKVLEIEHVFLSESKSK